MRPVTALILVGLGVASFAIYKLLKERAQPARPTKGGAPWPATAESIDPLPTGDAGLASLTRSGLAGTHRMD
jgi:hypothetical protein